MRPEELRDFKTWFTEYYRSFSTPLVEDQRNFSAKQVHTHEVCLNALRIAQDLGLNLEQTLLAEVIALFHDVGRFPQYQQYKTFDDALSVNHAVLSARVLHQKKVLHHLPKRDQGLVLRAVRLHNVFLLPSGLDAETLLFTRLIRDADKLDIMRVVLEFFEQDEGSRADAVALGLPHTPGYSPEVLACVLRGEMARKEMLKTQNDFKLLQLSWMYDLNFSSSYQMVVERNMIRKLSDMLPRTDVLTGAISIVQSFVNGKVADC